MTANWNGKSGVYWYALAKLQIAACDFESARESFESAVQDKTEPFIGELNELRNDVARKLLAAEFGAPNH
ncbi:hypothetical protein GC170_21295 [bacterium]|nr:hypothetical protein [bacterium]